MSRGGRFRRCREAGVSGDVAGRALDYLEHVHQSPEIEEEALAWH
jgi:hypothetical protein